MKIYPTKMVMFMYKDKVSTKKHGDKFTFGLFFRRNNLPAKFQPKFGFVSTRTSTSKGQLDVLPVGAFKP
jgi:hypothetical protein